MVENILNDLGYKVFNLGSNLPVYDLLDFLDKHNPKYIFLSIIYIEDVELMNKELKLLSQKTVKKNIKILLKGAGVDRLNTNYSNCTIVNTFKKIKFELNKSK
tara:strand:- start:304 stop:612 length:309 start_codon:yes stop_codon:yes gene_type:complete